MIFPVKKDFISAGKPSFNHHRELIRHDLAPVSDFSCVVSLIELVELAQKGLLLNDDEVKAKLFAATDSAEIKLPELSRESELRPTLIQIDEQLQTNHAPNVRQRNVSANRLQPHVSVEGKELTVFDKAVEGITVEVITMRRIGRPIGI